MGSPPTVFAELFQSSTMWGRHNVGTCTSSSSGAAPQCAVVCTGVRLSLRASSALHTSQAVQLERVGPLAQFIKQHAELHLTGDDAEISVLYHSNKRSSCRITRYSVSLMITRTTRRMRLSEQIYASPDAT